MSTPLVVALHGATGTRGRPVAGACWRTATTSAPSSAAPRARPAARPAAADLLDARSLAGAYAGTDAVVVRLPAVFDDRAWRMARGVVAAVHGAQVQRVVVDTGCALPAAPTGLPFPRRAARARRDARPWPVRRRGRPAGRARHGGPRRVRRRRRLHRSGARACRTSRSTTWPARSPPRCAMGARGSCAARTRGRDRRSPPCSATPPGGRCAGARSRRCSRATRRRAGSRGCTRRSRGCLRRIPRCCASAPRTSSRGRGGRPGGPRWRPESAR